MAEDAPPTEIGSPGLFIHRVPNPDELPPLVPRMIRSAAVGLMFSAIPILVTNLVLTKGEARLHPFSFSAAIPVLFVAFNLMRPRERWYALGDAGLAVGEKYFGQIRWESARFNEIETVKVMLHRSTDAQGTYQFTGFRYRFEGSKRKLLVVEGDVEEAPPRGTEIRLPPDPELAENHPLRVARSARVAWEKASGSRATIEVI